MARVVIDLPDRFVFSTEIQIYIGHINYGNHLDNSAMLSLVSEARIRFLGSMGYGELDVEGFGLFVADAAICYRSEAHLGETLVFSMAPADPNPYGFDLVYQVTEKVSGREVARGKTGLVFFDFTIKRAAKMPAAFMAKAGF
jgi:4-hydroxybenzoyl-CoA thioesterase